MGGFVAAAKPVVFVPKGQAFQKVLGFLQSCAWPASA